MSVRHSRSLFETQIQTTHMPDLDAKSSDSRPIACPHCRCELSEREIRSIRGRFARSKRLSSVGASRFANMTPAEKSAEQERVSRIRWAKERSQKDSIA